MGTYKAGFPVKENNLNCFLNLSFTYKNNLQDHCNIKVPH